MGNDSYVTSISVRKVRFVEEYYFEFKSNKTWVENKEILLKHPSEYLKVGRFFDKAGVVLSYRRMDGGDVVTCKGILEFLPDSINYSIDEVKKCSLIMVIKQILINLKADDEKWIENNDDLIDKIKSSWGSDGYWKNIRMEAFKVAKEIVVQDVMLD